MTTTQNLHLPQWEADDRIMRTDFNDAMSKIDTGVKAANDAAAAAPHIIVGSYTGNGQSYRTINLGVTPKAVLLFMDGNKTVSGDGNTRYGGLAVTGRDTDALRLCENGFIVYCESYYFSNLSSSTYTYLALY